jgi:hypothetical protein
MAVLARRGLLALAGAAACVAPCAAQFRAVAVMRGASGAVRGTCGEVSGTVTFEQAAALGDMVVTYDLTGVAPGEHGFQASTYTSTGTTQSARGLSTR